MRFNLLLLTFFLFAGQLSAQMNDFGFINPTPVNRNMTMTDIEGVTHKISDYLDAGTHLVIWDTATTCSTCYSYGFAPGQLHQLYAEYGPEGTIEPNKVQIIMLIGGDFEALDGSNGGVGDYTDGTEWPICFNGVNGFSQTEYTLSFRPHGYETYHICPSGATRRFRSYPDYDWSAELIDTPWCDTDPSMAQNGSMINQSSGYRCSTGTRLLVDLMNTGGENITNAEFTVSWNGTQQYSQNWSGNLTPNNYTRVDLGLQSIPADADNVEIELLLPGDTDPDGNLLEIELLTPEIVDDPTLIRDINYNGSDWWRQYVRLELLNDQQNSVYSEGVQNVSFPMSPFDLYIDYSVGSTFPGTAESDNITSAHQLEMTLPEEGCYTGVMMSTQGHGFHGASEFNWNPLEFDILSGNQSLLPLALDWGYYEVMGVEYKTSTTSTTETAQISPLKVSPNPVSDRLQVNLPTELSGTVQLTLYNTLGVLVKTEKFNTTDNLSVNVADFPAGSYLLRAETEEGNVFVNQIIKQ